MSLLIKGGIAFLGSKYGQKDILIEDGRIAGVGNSLQGDDVIKASGLIVLPGLIDPHVHLREPGDTYKEDFATGSRAAIAGGFTTVIDMPNNAIPTTTKKRLDEKIRLAKKKAVCDVFFHFGGTDDNFDEVKKADPGSLKLYLGQTTGGMALKQPFSLEKHFINFPKDRPVVLHACDHSEDEKENIRKTLQTLENSLGLAERLGRRVHLAHASTGKEIQIARRYARCSIEVAPHHLFLSTNDFERLGPYAKVYPPLRSEQKQISLWSALDKVDCIATDHAPHTIEDKERGAAGFPGLETSMALMLTGCRRGLLDKIWVAQRMSGRVASLFNMPDRGRLEKGCIGDITIIDPKKKWKVDATELETKCKWTPFDGMELTGKVHTVIKNGEILFEKYQLLV
ncbi:MAG: dihydroorotase family protein [Candidatus Micrarchaeota archaeon]